jgi:hypothetical protein
MYHTILDYMGYISDFHQVGRRIYQWESVLGPGPVVIVVGCIPYPGFAGSLSFGLVPGSVVVADAETGEGRIEYRSFVVDCNLMDRHYSVAALMRCSSNTLQIQSVAMVVPYIAAVGAGWLVVHMVMVGRWSDRRLAILEMGMNCMESSTMMNLSVID